MKDIFLKCLYCKEVRTKMKVYKLFQNGFISLKTLIGESNLENFLFRKGNFYRIEEINDNYKDYLKISEINNICETHKNQYISFCEECKINLCDICEKKHKNHKIQVLISYKLCYDELEEIKNIIQFLKVYNEKINDLIINKNIAEPLKNEVYYIMNIDSTKIPKNDWEKYPIIEKIKDFPLLFHKFYLYIKNNENFDNSNKSISKNESSIEEIFNRIENDINDWEKFTDSTLSNFEIYSDDINSIINIAEWLLNIYEFNKNKLNYQMCFNLKNIQNSLYYEKDYLSKDDFEFYNLIINKYINDPQIIKNYECVKEYFSKDLLDLNLEAKDLTPIFSTLSNTSLLLNIPIQQIKMFNWIYNENLCNSMIYNIKLN